MVMKSDSIDPKAITEYEIYHYLLPAMQHVCDEINLDVEDFSISAGSGYSSVYFDKKLLIMRLKNRGKSNYLSIPKAYASDFSGTVEVEISKAEPGFARIPCSLSIINTVVPLVDTIIRAAINRIPKAYDCCSLYEKCSDAKKCVHPDKKGSLQCGYKRILESGTIYYGKNRNIE
jgi:hypothetical protein